MVDRIDAFAHVLPRPFYRELNEAHPSDELQALEGSPRFYDSEYRLDVLDEFGIDRQVITLARPPIWRGIDPAEALALTQAANDAVREFADESDRFIAVGTLPFVTDDYLPEYERCVDDLDMAGVQIFSNAGGEPIDSDAHRRLYARAAARETPIWLHPQLHEWHAWDEEYMLHKILGWPFDTSLSMTRLVMSGILDEHPDLAIIPHHMGAMIPHFASRIELFHRMLVEHRDVYPYPLPEFDGSVVDQLRQFYPDSCRGGAASVLEDGLEFFGEDRLLFATDYPFGPDEGKAFLEEEIAGVEAMEVDESTREDVFAGNVEKLL